MNKLSNYFLLLFISAGFLFLASCGEDTVDPLPDTGATITGLRLSPEGTDTTGTDVAPGASAEVYVAYELNGATGITLNAFAGDSALFTSPIPLSSTTISPTQTSFRVPADATEDFTVEYRLQDADGTVVAREEFNITLDIRTEARVYNPVLLQAPLGQTPGERNSKTFFSATSGKIYTVDEVVNGTNGASSDSIHFGYYYGSGTQRNLASLASPAEYPESIQDLGPSGANWTTLNETSFRRIEGLTPEAFNDLVLSDEVGDQFEKAGNADESGVITQLAVDDVYAFSYTEGDNTKFGILRVDAISAGDGANGSITLTVKVPAEED